MNEAYRNIMTRRSVRKFTPQPIPRNLLEEIVQAGLFAPSGKNEQSWQFTCVQNPAIIAQLEKSVETNLERESYSMYHSQCLILLSNARENTNGLADCACALENIFLAAHSMGIGSVWINQLKTICDCPDMRQILHSLEIPDNHIVWGIAALGYPAETSAAKPRTAVVKYF